MKRVRDSLGRPIRTGQQGGVVYGLVETLTAFERIDLTPRQYGAVVVFGTAALAWAQVQVENRLGRAFLRTVPRPKKRRKRRRAGADAGHIDALLVVLVAVLLVVLVLAGRL